MNRGLRVKSRGLRVEGLEAETRRRSLCGCWTWSLGWRLNQASCGRCSAAEEGFVASVLIGLAPDASIAARRSAAEETAALSGSALAANLRAESQDYFKQHSDPATDIPDVP